MTGIVPWLVVALPLAAATGLGFAPRLRVPRRPVAGWGALAAAVLTLGCALTLPWQAAAGDLLRVDPLSAHLAILAAAAAVLTAWRERATATGIEAAIGLTVLGGIQIAALSNNLMLGWAGLELALLAVLLGGRPGREAAWRAAATLLPALALVLAGALVVPAQEEQVQDR